MNHCHIIDKKELERLKILHKDGGIGVYCLENGKIKLVFDNLICSKTGKNVSVDYFKKQFMDDSLIFLHSNINPRYEFGKHMVRCPPGGIQRWDKWIVCIIFNTKHTCSVFYLFYFFLL